MKKLLVVLGSLLLLFSQAQAGALVHTIMTGRVVAINEYHDRTVRVTVERLSWPNSHRYIVIRPNTKIYREKRPAVFYSPGALRKGELVRAEGGLTTFGNRIVADSIVILPRD